MKKVLSTIFVSVFLGALLVLQGTAQTSFQPRPSDAQREANSRFISTFVEKLDARLKGKSAGYAFYVTYKNGLAHGRAGGDARRLPDPDPRKMTLDDKFNIASVSKTISAAAVLKLLNEKQLKTDTSIAAYLPPDWTLGNNFKTITFGQLLKHRSGIRCAGNVTYGELKKCAADGINIENKNKPCGNSSTICYNNSNYGLFRLIIPRLSGAPSMILIPGKPKPDDSKYSTFYSNQYIAYVQKNIFAPAGLTGVVPKPIPNNPALTYQFPSPEIAGTSFGDMTESTGSQGWNMNVKQLSAFLTTLMNTEKILPAAVSKQMRDEQLGLFSDSTTVSGITSYEHGGYYPGKSQDGKIFNPGELNSGIFAFSNGLNVTVIVNSQLGPGKSIPGEVKAALKEAIK